MNLLSNTHQLLVEACKSELCMADNIMEDDIESSFEDTWKDMPELSQPLMYTEEQVPVFGIGEGAERAIVVEYDNLAKYMVSNNIEDVVEALDRLKEHYNFEQPIELVVESYDSAVEVVEEAKKLNQKAAEKTGLAKVKSSTDLIRDLKEKGVKVWKQKGIRKGKKK